MGLSGRPLVVHASLSAFGRVERGADTVVAALRGTCPTVMAPAFCFEPNWTPPPDDRPARNGCDYAYYDGWDRPRIPWRVESATIDRSMGVVSHALCAEPGARRSDHPWHSWLAAGEWAEELTTPHPWTTTNLPLERLAAAGGHVLLMGVSLTSCTAVHIAEERAGRQPFIRWMVDRDDVVRRIRVAGCSKGFDRLWSECNELFAETTVGNATLRSAPLTPLIDHLASLFQADQRIAVCHPTCVRCRDAALGGPED